MKNKKFAKLLIAFFGIAGFYACSKSFLQVTPQGVLDVRTLSTEKGVNKILLGAYAMLDGEDGGLNIGTGVWGAGASNFVFGSMAGGEANRGSTPGDQGPNMTNALRHESAPLSLSLSDDWKGYYEGIKRTNTVLQVLANVKEISDASKSNITGQARFLRAWYHFQARIIFGRVPYINELTDDSLTNKSILSVANDKEIWPDIIADAQYAYQNLPATQDSKGRINKWTAGALLGKVLMFSKDYSTAKTVLDDVVANGTTSLGVKFALSANYDDNFNLDFENSAETVLDFQASSQDNAGARNANWGDQLNMPASGATGGAGFFTPTFWFTNQFKTDASGLPVPFGSAENNVVMDPAGTSSATGAAPGYTQYAGNVDVRLDWTVGRNGVPFLDWGTFLTTWRRDPTAGPFCGKKIMIRQSQVATSHDASIWFVSGGNALNIHLLRFSDILLLDAEAAIEANDLITPFMIVNMVRTRAGTSEKVVFPAIYGVPVTNAYVVPFASQDEARTAVRLERLLELGMEGHRFFDLVRWGIAATDLTNFYNYESAIPYQTNGDLTPKPTYTSANQDYYAIPQQQIDLSHGLITQNP